jgi:DNA-binding XRE family transcriptional regulator
MSQTEVAEAARLSRTSVAHIELGKQDCSLQTFIKLSLALGVASHILLREATNEPTADDAWARKIIRQG